MLSMFQSTVPQDFGDGTGAVDHLRAALINCRNADGGWAYYAGKKSRLEPTACALMAIACCDAVGAGDAVVRTAALFARWQRTDGLMACVPGAPPSSAFNGLAALALLSVPPAAAPAGGVHSVLKPLLDGIVRSKGSKAPLMKRITVWLAPSRKISRQNDDLQGWSWLEGTFSWVEPTAWCLLALKKAGKLLNGSSAGDRIEEAERLLMDRCCLNGGWNYGNSNMLGKELRPYVPTTAIALLALQDRRETQEVRRSFEFLRLNQLKEESGLALALAALALRTYGSVSGDVEARLREQLARTGFLGNNVARALALCALSGGQSGCRPFAL